MYKIEFSKKAAKIYYRLPNELRVKISSKIKLLTKEPYAKNNNIKPLIDLKNHYRLRVGDWRIIYEIISKKVTIYVIKIGHRKEVYKQ